MGKIANELVKSDIYYLFSDAIVDEMYLQQFDTNHISSSDAYIQGNNVYITVRIKKYYNVSYFFQGKKKVDKLCFNFYDHYERELVSIETPNHHITDKGSHIEIKIIHNLDDLRNKLHTNCYTNIDIRDED